MKIIRSTKCNLKFATEHKLTILDQILQEYGKVTNLYIDYLWELPSITDNKQLLKPIVDLVSETQTWFTFRLRKVAVREALALVNSSRNKAAALSTTEKPVVAVKPHHYGNAMHVSSTVAKLELSKESTEFDAWLCLTCIGNKLKLRLPIRLHKHYHKLGALGQRQESYVISRNSVQLSFVIMTEPKKQTGSVVGIDTGIKSLATLSDGTKFGKEVELHINRIQRCKHGSKGQQRARASLRQYIDKVVKSFPWEDLKLIVVENIKNIARNTRRGKKFVIKKLRKMLGNWNYRYWLRRLQYATELHRVSFRSVSPYQTSIRCSSCGHVEQANRSTQEKFLCRSCGYTDNADINAAKNILERFCSGPYGARFKPNNIIGYCNV